MTVLDDHSGDTFLCSDELLAMVGVVLRSPESPHIVDKAEQLMEFGVGKVIIVGEASSLEMIYWNHPALKTAPDSVNIRAVPEGGGWVACMNEGIRTAMREGCPYILTLSTESEVSHEDLLRMVRVMHGERSLDVVGAMFRGYFYGEEAEKRSSYPLGPSFQWPRSLCCLYRADAFGKIGMFEEDPQIHRGLPGFEFLLRLRQSSLDRAYTQIVSRIPLPIHAKLHFGREVHEAHAMREIVKRRHALLQKRNILEAILFTELVRREFRIIVNWEP